MHEAAEPHEVAAPHHQSYQLATSFHFANVSLIPTLINEISQDVAPIQRLEVDAGARKDKIASLADFRGNSEQ